MARFVKGDVVVVPFPFSNLAGAKRRPALVVATLTGEDVILCQITSQTVRDTYSVTLGREDFLSGGLKQLSNIRPNRLFTAASGLILYKAGQIRSACLEKVHQQIVAILRC
ncbi:type II toxin-antitoxin system PemK/MazF family toxin [Spirulina major CS-329]|uniref:type II toxin-antitoxin system PemK/MazF family toxin n=1 Tax=Spirulina TaxID=1154 RepID=UPI002330DA92|nr:MULTISPECIES: type II toxin-antitoxin system PemK/MazF family toxin [Spirulina]MDB9495597.1 type II toxin-antitoxin system PemK/MazF family toxin [Spirulina subsalsa CS-330]MDB9502159.1 type II toxin-antitoxin system PemK/MazF family toxin [Spirulina major CS-329]